MPGPPGPPALPVGVLGEESEFLTAGRYEITNHMTELILVRKLYATYKIKLFQVAYK